MENIKVTGDNKDKRLEYILETVKKSVASLKERIEDERFQYALKYETVILKGVKVEEQPSIIDVLQTAIAIEIKNQMPDTIKTLTYKTFKEVSEECEEDFSLWVAVIKETPDYSNIDCGDKPAPTPMPHIEDASGCDISGTEVLIEASGMGHADSRQHIRMDV